MNGQKRDSIRLEVHLSRHLQVLVVSFPECFPPDHVARLKHDHFYGGLPKRLKAMVAYLKASTNEKTYSDYLGTAREAEKEMAIDTSHSQTADSTSKPKVISQSTNTPAVQVAHLEEERTDKGEGTESEDPDGIKAVTEEFIVHLARAVKDDSAGGEMLLPLQQPRALYPRLPIGKGIQNRLTFKLKGGDIAKEGSLGPSREGSHAEGAPRQDTQGVRHHTQTSFLNPDPFN